VEARVTARDDVGGWLEGAVRRRLLFHLTDDRSVEGVMTLAAVDGVVLWAAKLKGSPEVDLAGEVFIPREKILLVQTLRQ
jgi:hypothetical protein